MTGSPSGVLGCSPAQGAASLAGAPQSVNASVAARLMAAIRRGLIFSSRPPNSIVPASRTIPFSGVTATRASSSVSEVRSRTGAGE